MMNELSCHIILYVLLASITGSVMYLIWMILNRTLKNYLPAEVLLIGLEVCLILFLVPITYIRMFVLMAVFKRHVELNVFDVTPEMMDVLKVIFIMWLVGFALFLMVFLYTKARFRHNRRRDSYMDESHMTNDVLKKLRQDLKIKKKISVYRSAGIKTAVTFGILKPYIILSKERFTEEASLKVVLLHEMIHIKKRDALTKHMGVIIRCIFWFHPLVHIIIKNLCDHMEFRCDELCCGSIDETQYFRTLIASVAHTKSGMFFVYNGFGESNSELIRRIKHMKNKKHLSKTKKLCSVLAVVLAMNVGVVSAYAANVKISNDYNDIYENESSYEKINSDIDTAGEIIEEDAGVNEAGITEIDITDTMLGRSTNFETGTIPVGVRTYVTLYMRCGQKITVTAIISPSDRDAKVGLVKPDGSKLYVRGQGALTKTFTITTSGTHKIYVENPNSFGNISAVVNYNVK